MQLKKISDRCRRPVLVWARVWVPVLTLVHVAPRTLRTLWEAKYTGDENLYNENIILYDGVKLLCNATNKKLDIRKNETLIVDKWDDEYIYIGEKVIPIYRLHTLFLDML